MSKIKFWTTKDNGEVKIIQSKLIQFLEMSGFARAEQTQTTYVLVWESNNTVVEVEDHTIIKYVKNYLIKIEEDDVLEQFSKGVTNYLSKGKLKLLKTVELLKDKDPDNSSWFYFKNSACQVTKKSMRTLEYKDFQGKIWKNRILKRKFWMLGDNKESQFQQFCFNISRKNEERFEALCSVIGYLLHRCQDLKNPRAVILVDETISSDGTANGGTGKSLLIQAIGKLREVVVMDGKSIKTNSWFKNQRITRTTDVIFYDDVTKDFSLEELYSMITTGITVEKKHRDELYIPPEDAPKICVSSNYIVNGAGGSTDIRRRCDFEIANHYSEKHRPFDEFKTTFFTGWDDLEWNRFYHFMLGCVQVYLNKGLIIPDPINLKVNTLINATCQEFVAFVNTGVIEINSWNSKKTTLELIKEEYPNLSMLTPHQLTKWFKEYARQTDLIYDDRKSGPKYEFILKTVRKEARDEEE